MFRLPLELRHGFKDRRSTPSRTARYVLALAIWNAALGCARKTPPREPEVLRPKAAPVHAAACPPRMVLVPGGFFKSADLTTAGKTIRTFCLDRTEVTSKEYMHCVQNKRCPGPGTWPTPLNPTNPPPCTGYDGSRPNHPANCVTFAGATSYCATVLMRLPSAQEWVWAARAGNRANRHPWGNGAPHAAVCWENDSPCRAGASPGDSTPLGVMDMAGNVTEWVTTDLDQSSHLRLQMGGAFSIKRDADSTSVGQLADPDTTIDVTAGFRCARNAVAE